MKNNLYSGLLTKNKLGNIPGADQPKDHLEVVKAFARLTYQSLYVIDYTDMSFDYVSDNPLFLCGYSAEEVLQAGYDFYFKHVPPEDLQLLTTLNEAGFNFYRQLPEEERLLYSITYDFHLIDRNGRQVLINHKLTPLFLNSEGEIWKALCIVSISHHQTAGNVRIYKQGSDEVWDLRLTNNAWRKSDKPTLTERETEVLRLHAQGLTISEIAQRLHVAPDTVKYYRRRIFERLNVDNMTEALSYAINSKII